GLNVSKIATTITQMTIQEFLVAALKELGIPCEVHAVPAALRTYDHSQRTAEIIVRGDNLGKYPGLALSDAGFTLQDGTYTLLADDFCGGYQQFLNHVSQAYAEQKYIATMEQQGFVYQSREVFQ